MSIDPKLAGERGRAYSPRQGEVWTRETLFRRIAPGFLALALFCATTAVFLAV